MKHFGLLIVFLLSSCTVSEEMIAYKGIRAVGRVATEVTTGIAVPDVCDTIDEIVEEEEAEATDKSG